MDLIIAPHPSLTKQTPQAVLVFDKALVTLAREMRAIMIENHGIGLAANQVGSDLDMFVTHSFVCCNPRLTVLPSEGFYKTEEGCLSLPGKVSVVNRAKAVLMTWQDVNGKSWTKRLQGRGAQIAQHECGHLRGVLI